MSWLGVWCHDKQLFDPAGLHCGATSSVHAPADRTGAAAIAAREAGAEADHLLVKGSLMLEMRLPERFECEPMLVFERGGDWPLRLAVTYVPSGGLRFELDQYGSRSEQDLMPPQDGRGDWVRLTYSWDAPQRLGRLAIERQSNGAAGSSGAAPGLGRAQIWQVKNPCPWRLADLRALLSSAESRFIAPHVKYIAVSDQMEPVGPMPGLAGETLMTTAEGLRPIAALKRGDLIRNIGGDLVPILHVVARDVPASGAFKPITIKAPFFGLQHDLVLAPYQRLAMTGAQVDYLYGSEAVSAPICTLTGARTVQEAKHPWPVIRYYQLILPQHEVALAAGLGVECLFLGRIRRDLQALAASVCSDVDRNALPEHAKPKYPVLRAFDGSLVTDQRLA